MIKICNIFSSNLTCTREDTEEMKYFKSWNAQILKRLNTLTYPEFAQTISNISSQKTEVVDNKKSFCLYGANNLCVRLFKDIVVIQNAT